MKTKMVNPEIERLLEEQVYLSKGIVPMGYIPDRERILELMARLSPDEQRKMKRKFRKAWRHAAQLTPRQVRKYRVSGGPHVRKRILTRSLKRMFGKLDLAVGHNPNALPKSRRGIVSRTRKLIVHMAVTSQVGILVKKFKASLSEHLVQPVTRK